VRHHRKKGRKGAVRVGTKRNLAKQYRSSSGIKERQRLENMEGKADTEREKGRPGSLDHRSSLIGA